MKIINRRFLPYALVGALMFALGATFFSSSPPPREAGGFGGAFSLLDGDGKPVTEAVFAGKPHAIMFGFTHCPDVCPAGLARMRTWLDALGEDKKAVRFAFVTVDPARDSPEVLSRYVGYFSPDILPLSGDKEQIGAMLKAYGVYAKKVALESGGYTMDHHSAVFLFDDDGQFKEFIYADDPQQTALEKLSRLRRL